jgi:dimethylglycine oxidase
MNGNRPTAVLTDQGKIETEMVLLCTNIWGTVLAEKVSIKLPLMAVQHLYTVTEPIPELANATDELEHPILREQDTSMYLRQHRQAYGVGSYRHEPLLVHPRDVGKTATLPFTPEHLDQAWNSVKEILPAVGRVPIARAFNGMFVFTVDGMSILGPAPGLENFWVANGIWVTHAGGMGMVLAEWMDTGAPTIDLHEVDISRFHDHVHSPYYSVRCAAQQYREVYDIIHPMQQMEHTRNMRLTPYHARLQELQGKFFHSAGWERPQWYESNARVLEDYEDQAPERTGWEARYWSRIQGAEHLATRERAALFELSSFVKIEVSGPGAAEYLEYLSANRVARETGRVVYTSMLDKNGGIICDLTVTRLGPDRFWVLTGGGSGMHDLEWIRRNAPKDGSVHVQDISSKYTSIGLWGPKARTVLQSITQDDVSNENFPYFTTRHIYVREVPVTAMRISYVGELGWELYTPMEYGLRLWDVLWEAGKQHGMVVGGMGAFDSLRLEKGYRFWGPDIHPEINPYEAGLGWAVRLNKGDFLGRDALVKIKEKGITRKLCCLTFDSPDAIALGKEPIFLNGKRVGYVTSTNYGYSVGKHILYSYLPIGYAGPGTQAEVEYFGVRHQATVQSEPLFDPEMARLKG